MNISGVNFTGGFVVSPAVDNQFNYVTALLHGDGASAGQNNTFLDSSTNNFAITRTGSTTQGSYGPYGSLWSNYFNGTSISAGSSISGTLTSSIGSGNFTVEFWAYHTTLYDYIDWFSITRGTTGFNIGTNNAGEAVLYFNSARQIATSAGTIAKNTWYHVALVRSGTTITMYLNGTSIGSTTTTTNSNFTATGFYIGSLDNTQEYMPGYISNLRLLIGTALYTSSFTPPTAPLTVITNTSLLTCQSNRFRDNSTNNLTITRTGTPSVQVFSPFGATTQYNPTVNGGSAYFGTTTDYLTVPSSSNFAFGTGDFTVEAWLYPVTAPNAGGTFFIVGSTTNGFIFGYQNATSWGAASNGGSWFITSTTLPTLNAWNYISITRSSGTAYLFLNGVLLTSAASAQNFPAMSTFIGHPSTTSSVNGYLSNLRALQGTALYTTSNTPPTTPLTAITNTALLLNFTNSQIFDNAMMNNLVTVGNAQVSTSIYKYGTGSLYFDGTGDWLVPTNLLPLGSGDFTVEMWLYPNATYSGTYAGLLDSRTSADGAGLVYFGYTGTANQIGWKDNTTFVVTGTVTVSTWNHVAIVRRSGTMTMYINGTSTSSAANSTNYTVAFRLIGSSFDPFSLNGYIDELRITNGIARYTSNFTAPTSLFPSTGPIPIYPPTVEYLVVAGGGGGGGKNTGGGGGAGGFRTATGFAIAPSTSYTVTVGGGGNGGTSPSQSRGSNGIDSVFSTITSTGGGGGAQGVPPNAPNASLNGSSGGSGGGGGGTDSGGGGTAGSGNTPSTSPSQGNNGGNANNGANGGGGGGSGAVGATATTGQGGAGGAGTLSTISGSSVTYAGGGGGGGNSAGGAGGAGGGGIGGFGNPASAATAGTVNTGSGGGGAGGFETTISGGAGGSGVVIIRYSSSFNLASSTTGNPTITTTGGYNTYTWTSSGSITF